MLQLTKPPKGAKPGLAAITPDPGLAEQITEKLGDAGRFAVTLHRGRVEDVAAKLALKDVAVLVIDLDDAGEAAIAALQRLAARAQAATCIVVTRSFDERLARALLQARIPDFLVKPVSADSLTDACARALHGALADDHGEADIISFLPATGGVGCTTLAIHAALLLQQQDKARALTCLVDLDFQQGVCAEYLDLEPRLDLNEIEPRPERLDRQLLEIMLSRHASGLSVVAAAGRPGEPVSVDLQAISRLLDLVAANFDHVVIDLPRHWFGWTDSVLLGSNRLFVVAEMTVPALRQARRLATVVSERLEQAPAPRIIVNRFESGGFRPGLRRSDVEQALGGYFAGTVPNKYGLVREAIDQGVPLSSIKSKNAVLDELAKLVLPAADTGRRRSGLPLLGRVLAR